MSQSSNCQGNVTLYIVGEVLHEGDKVRPGCHVYATVHLEVKEMGALECMVLVSRKPLVQKRQVPSGLVSMIQSKYGRISSPPP